MKFEFAIRAFRLALVSVPAAVLVLAYQNCDRVSFQAASSSRGSVAERGGEGYGGKIYREINVGGPCADGNPYKTQIRVSTAGVALLDRENCGIAKPREVRLAISSDAATASYDGIVLNYDAPSATVTECATGQLTGTSSYAMTIATRAIGDVVADALAPSAFLHPAGKIFSTPLWSTREQTYWRADDYRSLSAQTRYCSRDMEVTTFTRNGLIFLRLGPTGDGVYLHLNEETNALTLGRVANLREGYGFRYEPGTGAWEVLYETLSLTTTIPGYDKNVTDDHQFTFGVAGTEIYLKFKGREFIRVRDPHPASVGRAAIQGNNGYGFRDVHVSHLKSATN